MKRKIELTATVDRWAKAIGIQHRTLQIKLTKAGIMVEPHGLLSARQVFTAMQGDGAAERTRLVTAKADAQEMENRRRDGELVEIAVANRMMWGDILMPLRTELDMVGENLAALVNPDNVELATKFLIKWAEQVKQNISRHAKTQLTNERNK